jgi:hypothetical protein
MVFVCYRSYFSTRMSFLFFPSPGSVLFINSVNSCCAECLSKECFVFFEQNGFLYVMGARICPCVRLITETTELLL